MVNEIFKTGLLLFILGIGYFIFNCYSLKVINKEIEKKLKNNLLDEITEHNRFFIKAQIFVSILVTFVGVYLMLKDI